MSDLESQLSERLNSLPPRMSHVVRPWAERTGSAPALLQGRRRLSYQDLAASIESVGRWLQERGVQPGDRVLVVGENSIELAVLILAIGEVDAWPVVVNARISVREVDAIRSHCGPRVVVFTPAVSPEAAAHAHRLNGASEDLGPVGVVAVTESDPAATAEPVCASGAEQVGALIYTSGTTGAPKGVMLSHRNILFTAAVGGVMRSIRPEDRTYGVLPMSHIVGFSSVLVGSLMFGACLELVPRFDAALTLQALKDQCPTIFLGVPTMYQRLLEASGGSLAAPELRTIGVAGAPLDLSLKNAVEQAFHLPLHNGYGITECAPTIAFTRHEDPRQDTTVGPPIPHIEVHLRAAGGDLADPGEVGELHVRGPNVMLGYYRAPELTAAVIDREGWFNTGDLARMDGPYLHIVGRTKELIIRSGFNIYPPEVEAVFTSHPAVALSAVVGRKVPGNEEVVAFVQLRAGMAATAEELSAFAAQHLAPYKRPAEIVIRQSLPATSAGKILKHQLAKEAHSNE